MVLCRVFRVGVVNKVTMSGGLGEVFCRPLEQLLVTGVLNVPPSPH